MRRGVRRRVGGRVALLAAALLAVGLVGAGSAGATTFSWSVAMTGQDVIDSGLPAIASATGSASITANDATNQICGTFSWSGVASPVAFGHIHEGQKGVVENPGFTVNLFGPDLSGAPNPVTGCTILPGTVIDEMARTSAFFNVVIHNQQFPGGALRGQLGSGSIFCKDICPPPV
jgi:CHRD domain